jgi:hypothetical protein
MCVGVGLDASCVLAESSFCFGRPGFVACRTTWDGVFAVKNMAQSSRVGGPINATILYNSRVYIQAIEFQKNGRFCCTNSSMFQVFVCVSTFLDVRVIFLGSGEERTAPAGGALGSDQTTGIKAASISCGHVADAGAPGTLP